MSKTKSTNLKEQSEEELAVWKERDDSNQMNLDLSDTPSVCTDDKEQEHEDEEERENSNSKENENEEAPETQPKLEDNDTTAATVHSPTGDVLENLCSMKRQNSSPEVLLCGNDWCFD